MFEKSSSKIKTWNLLQHRAMLTEFSKSLEEIELGDEPKKIQLTFSNDVVMFLGDVISENKSIEPVRKVDGDMRRYLGRLITEDNKVASIILLSMKNLELTLDSPLRARYNTLRRLNGLPTLEESNTRN